LREDFAEELIIWRPVMEGLVSLADVKTGLIDIVDLTKLNSLMDMKAAYEQKSMEDAQRK
jgi:hypothetical protein